MQCDRPRLQESSQAGWKEAGGDGVVFGRGKWGGVGGLWGGPSKTERCLNTYFHWEEGRAPLRALIRILKQAGL